MSQIKYNIYNSGDHKYMNWIGKYTYGSFFYRGGYLFLNPKYGAQINISEDFEASNTSDINFDPNSNLRDILKDGPVFWNDFSHLKIYDSLYETTKTLVECEDKKELSTFLSDIATDPYTLEECELPLEFLKCADRNYDDIYNISTNKFFIGLDLDGSNEDLRKSFKRLFDLMEDNYEGRCFMHKKSELYSMIYFFDDYDKTIKEIYNVILIAKSNNVKIHQT